MFTEIEKKYRTGLSEQRFWRFYLPRAILVAVIMYFLTVVFGLNVWLMAGISAVLLCALVGIFFRRDMRAVMGDKKTVNFAKKLEKYAQADEKVRMEGLVRSLQKYNFRTKEDVRVALEYFERQRPIKTKTGVLEWVLSVAIALASIVAIAYNDEIRAVDSWKLIGIVGQTVMIVVLIIVPMIVIGLLVRQVFFSQAKIDSILIEDLAYVYVNFDALMKE